MNALALLLALGGGPLQGTPYSRTFTVGATAEVQRGPRKGVQLHAAWAPTTGLSVAGELFVGYGDWKWELEQALVDLSLRRTVLDGELGVVGSPMPAQVWLSAGGGAVLLQQRINVAQEAYLPFFPPERVVVRGAGPWDWASTSGPSTTWASAGKDAPGPTGARIPSHTVRTSAWWSPSSSACPGPPSWPSGCGAEVRRRRRGEPAGNGVGGKAEALSSVLRRTPCLLSTSTSTPTTRSPCSAWTWATTSSTPTS